MLNYKLNINCRAVFHYIALFLLITTQKGVFARLLNTKFLVLIFGISILFLLFNFSIVKRNIAVFIMLGMSFSLMLMTMLLTQGSLNLTTIMRYITSFLFTLAVIRIDVEQFLRRYLKLVYIVSVISLLGFVSFSILNLPFYQLLPNNNGYYGLLLYNYSPLLFIGGRNIGISSESGQFQIIVSSALYFALFKYSFRDIKTFYRYTIVFIVTLLTIQSTTGYFALVAILLVYTFSKLKENYRRKMRRFIICLGIVGMIYTMANLDSDNFITTNFIHKIFDSNYRLNLNQNTGGERVLSIITDLRMVRDHPIGMGFQQYEALWNVYAPRYSGFLSCSGITRDMAIIGIIPELIFLLFIFTGIWKNKSSYLDFALGIFLYINTGFSQTSSLNACFMLLAFYPQIPFLLRKMKPVAAAVFR